MKITSIEPILLSIPFTDGSEGTGIMPNRWSNLEFCLIRIESDAGLVGWGEGFGYFCNEAVASMVERAIAPIIIGRELNDPNELMDEVQRRMVLQGRHGISTFAQSGVDIALWDLKAKAEGVSIATLLGSKKRTEIPAYASLLRYADCDLVAHYGTQAASEGYREIKLHEIKLPEIYRCREAIGPDLAMMVDVNCGWSETFCLEVIPELKALDTLWLEEPIFPPEDFHTLACLREAGLPLAAGENACTASPFEEMLLLEAVDYLQPSITKVGGISEFQKICSLNRKHGTPLMPHSPYFGPGYLATLQMAAIEPLFGLFEYLYIDPEAWIYKQMPLPVAGKIEIPDGSGLGMDPSPEILERYATQLTRESLTS